MTAWTCPTCGKTRANIHHPLCECIIEGYRARGIDPAPIIAIQQRSCRCRTCLIGGKTKASALAEGE